MVQLKELLKGMSVAERKTIWSDTALLDKGLAFVGDKQKPALVAALGMFVPTTPAAGNLDLANAPHMSGAEADTFIQTEIAKKSHLKGFIAAAAGAGKKADGAVAVVDAATWAKVYNVQYPDKVLGTDDLRTNAYIANKNEDRPAMIHQDRGTRSTAIHESMHRYSELAVLNKFGSPLNEGITEYFTRLLTDKDGKPADEGGPSRTNYQENWEFVRDMLVILGANKTDREKALGEVYFEGQVDLLETKFKARLKASKNALSRFFTSDAQLKTKWNEFSQKVKGGDWVAAKGMLPK